MGGGKDYRGGHDFKQREQNYRWGIEQDYRGVLSMTTDGYWTRLQMGIGQDYRRGFDNITEGDMTGQQRRI